MSLNEGGIEILNNKSRAIDNIIEKAHNNGILIMGDNTATMCTPSIWRNKIRACGGNGIEINGEQCEPDIRGNIIVMCRKAGIKLLHNSVAHIGGSSKVDIKFIPSLSTQEAHKEINGTFSKAKIDAVAHYRSASGLSAYPVEEDNCADDVHLQKGAVAVMRGLENIPQILTKSYAQMDFH